MLSFILMIMRVLLRFVFLIVLIVGVGWAVKNNISELKRINLSRINVESIKSLVLPNINQATVSAEPSVVWTEEKLLGQINEYRKSNKLKILTVNPKLSQAAKARMASLMVYGDVDGKTTGISRTEAVKMAGYSYNWIGDLVLVDFFKVNNPIDYWKDIENANKTLMEKNFKEIGIAIQDSQDQVNVYVVLASPAVKASSAATPGTKVTWGGIELWNAVNKRREEMGVNPLKQKGELCTIAAIRLNQILTLGKLDDHIGFENTLNRDDLKWIKETYNLSEFLVGGYATPALAIAAWENTLGHRKLLAGGEYVWGCVYAQDTYGVAIAAY